MRTLSSTLTAAQKSLSSRPAVKVEILNQVGPAVRRAWSVLYTGSEADSYHAAVCPGDNSLVRARTDGTSLYRQRVAVPAANSDYSTWTVFTDSLVIGDGVALAALGAKVALFYTAYNAGVRTLYCRESTDYGATWGSAVQVKTTAETTGFKHVTAVYVSSDVLICFFTLSTDASIISRIKRTSGTWGTSAFWSNSTTAITGISASYGGTGGPPVDVQLLITGQDESSNYILWICVYGLGVVQTNDTWSSLKEIRKTNVGTSVSYKYPNIGYKDVFWETFQEGYTGSEAYNRPMGLHSPPQASMTTGIHHDDYKLPPISGSYGTAIANNATKAFLSTSKDLYWGPNVASVVVVSLDVVSVKQVIKPFGGAIEVVLRNDTGQYNTPAFDRGWELRFSPGYSGTAGAEYSPGQTYYIESMEYITGQMVGQASRLSGRLSGVLRIVALDALSWLGRSQARSALEFNKLSNEKTYKDLVEYFLGLAGFTLTVVSNSTPFTAQYPKVSIYAGTNYDDFIKKLYSTLTDLVYIRGAAARSFNPSSNDVSTYSYFAGSTGVPPVGPPVHSILTGRYASNSLAANRIQVQGGIPPVYADVFIQSEIDKVYSRFKLLSDVNADNESKAAYEAAALSNKELYHSYGGEITIPVNCGQELHDVIDITDSGAGLSAARRRVSGIELVYDVLKGKYFMTLILEAAEATYGI